MSQIDAFKAVIEQGYQFEGDSLILGGAMLEGKVVPEQLVKAPLKSLNRHGLIAGATGTGKTKTLQLISECLSDKGIPVMLMDIKGDLSGLAKPGENNPKLAARNQSMGLEYQPSGYPVELMTISDLKGVKLKATLLEFGPVLFSKILELSDAQEGVLAIVYRYCEKNDLPLLDLKDMKQVLQHITNEGKEEIAAEYGTVSPASVGAIMRKIVQLETQGAEKFFGEPSFEVEDLMHLDAQGRGQLSVLQLMDMQSKPQLFSTFMLSLLAEIYETFPEAGDLDKPKLILFIDEAHLIFDNASKVLLDQLEAIIKLIRSKGVGIFFVTQNPADIPDAVLSQLGMKVQHALRAFTAKDRKAIKLTAENYPLTDFYDVPELLTSLGIGEAIVTVLDEQGRPTPLAATQLQAPKSRMDVLSSSEIDALVASSKLAAKYNEDIDRESAYEILKAKLEAAEAAPADEGQTEAPKESKSKSKEGEKEEGMLESLSKNTMVRQMGRNVVNELTRGLLGALGLRRPSSRRRRW